MTCPAWGWNGVIDVGGSSGDGWRLGVGMSSNTGDSGA